MSVRMMSIVVVIKTLTLLVGGLITYYAYRAYQRTSHPALRALAVGFGVITVGSLFAGAVDQILLLTSDLALVVESGFTLVGFIIILYSLFVQ
jgi:energy-converting hydrogenase Eha subunit F